MCFQGWLRRESESFMEDLDENGNVSLLVENQWNMEEDSECE